MELLHTINIGSADDAHSIELYRGDLAALANDDGVDILVVSAFPDDYTETAGALIGALGRSGLSVADLAASKAIDFRSERSCWLSGPVDRRHGFSRLLCFEPLLNGTPPELVDDIFDSLDLVLLSEFRNSIVAMPLVATGDMGWPIEEMTMALLSAAAARLQIGLPLKTLKIVEHDADKASRIAETFRAFTARRGANLSERPARKKSAELFRGAPGDAPAAPTGWDIFISYSRKDRALVDQFVELLHNEWPDARVFLDSEEIRNGSDWINVLADAIDSSQRFVAIFSPDYFSSKWCRREFNAAIIRDDKGDDDILYPVFLRRDPDAPSLYLTFNHVDCCEKDLTKLQAATRKLVEQSRA